MRMMIIAFSLVALAANSPCAARQAAPVALNCDAGIVADNVAPANLHGQWDFLMTPRGIPSFGLMTIGFVGAEYGGSLAPTRTAPVVLRNVTLSGNALRMTVASREADVLFNGHVSANGDFMCGTVTYHGGETFPMIAHKRPMVYPSPSQAERAGRPKG